MDKPMNIDEARRHLGSLMAGFEPWEDHPGYYYNKKKKMVVYPQKKKLRKDGSIDLLNEPIRHTAKAIYKK
jgi:hypothetical protein